MFSLSEIFQLIIVTIVVGYIFSGVYSQFIKKSSKRFDWEDFTFSIYVAAPGIILHELMHKFVGMGLGINAFFEAWPTGLVIGVVLKLIGSSFILLAPGYVVLPGLAPGLEMFLTALAGPATNALLWGLGAYMIKNAKNQSRKVALFWAMTAKLNMWLFIFNMIPLPPLDGFKVLTGLIAMV